MDIIQKAALQAVKLLISIRADFKIILPTGEEYGELVVVPKKQLPTKRPLKYPMGTIRKYMRPFIANMVVGDVAEVPCGEFSLYTIQTSLCAMLRDDWGKEASMTSQNREKGVVEVLRLA